MYLLSLKSVLLLSALLAVSGSGLQILADDCCPEQPIGEASETSEFEFESESECKEGIELVLPECFVIQTSGLAGFLHQTTPLEKRLRVVLEQHAPRPPPVFSI